MKRFVILALALLAAGCQSTKAQVAGGAAFTVAGTALLMARGPDCRSMELGDAIDCGFEQQGQEMLGIVLLTAGASALVMAAVKARADDEAARRAEGKP